MNEEHEGRLDASMRCLFNQTMFCNAAVRVMERCPIVDCVKGLDEEKKESEGKKMHTFPVFASVLCEQSSFFATAFSCIFGKPVESADRSNSNCPFEQNYIIVEEKRSVPVVEIHGKIPIFEMVLKWLYGFPMVKTTSEDLVLMEMAAMADGLRIPVLNTQIDTELAKRMTTDTRDDPTIWEKLINVAVTFLSFREFNSDLMPRSHSKSLEILALTNPLWATHARYPADVASSLTRNEAVLLATHPSFTEAGVHIALWLTDFFDLAATERKTEAGTDTLLDVNTYPQLRTVPTARGDGACSLCKRSYGSSCSGCGEGKFGDQSVDEALAAYSVYGRTIDVHKECLMSVGACRHGFHTHCLLQHQLTRWRQKASGPYEVICPKCSANWDRGYLFPLHL